jgi:purine-binding chemotaxis protein CheW
MQELESNEYVGFKIDQKTFCINVQKVQETIYVRPISKIPNVPRYIEGAINLRGKIIKVINLRKWFGLRWESYKKDSRILIINLEENNVFGILVDSIYEVFKIEETMKTELPFLLDNQPEISYINNIILYENQLFLEIKPKTLQY